VPRSAGFQPARIGIAAPKNQKICAGSFKPFVRHWLYAASAASAGRAQIHERFPPAKCGGCEKKFYFLFDN